MRPSSICKDQDSPYDIRPCDKELIEAAIRFGAWIASQPEATEEQKTAVARVVSFLENLPSPCEEGLHGSFGFSIYPKSTRDEYGHLGCWEVCICRSFFEIFSCGREGSTEFAWELCPGLKNHNDMASASVWIQEVSEPRKLICPGEYLSLDARTWTVKD